MKNYAKVESIKLHFKGFGEVKNTSASFLGVLV